ncbi:MAG: hypothetical protein AAB467_02930 [Patescibacteria group bacterium]
MIYIIGGAPRVGKSIIAGRLYAKIGARLISTDNLEMPSNNLEPIGFFGNSEENILTPEARVELQIAEANLLQKTIQQIISKSVIGHEDVIIEGIHLLPNYVDRVRKEYGLKIIRPIFFGSRNIKLVFSGMVQNTNPNDWLKESSEIVRRQVAEFTCSFSRFLYQETRMYGLEYIEKSDNFESDVEFAMQYLTVTN